MFNKEYPNLASGANGQAFAKVIDNYMTYAQSAIDEFSDAKKMPQIAISLISAEILNMIALQGAVFNLEFQIAYKLQDINYQEDRLIEYRSQLVQMMTGKVRELNRENFAVRQHIKYVDLYSTESNYQSLSYEDTLLVREELAPLILPDSDEASAVRFDALMYGLELAQLAGRKYGRLKSDLLKKVGAIAKVANIPEILAQRELIDKVLNTDYVERAGIEEL